LSQIKVKQLFISNRYCFFISHAISASHVLMCEMCLCPLSHFFVC
jgi:hypothetical protein